MSWVAVHHIGDAYTFAACCLLAPLARRALASASVIADFHWLQVRCMRWVFLRSSGEPPRDRGMSSSTSARMGWGTHPMHPSRGHFGPCSPGVLLSVLSTGWSHSAQLVSSASTRLRSSLRLCPLALCAGVATFNRLPLGLCFTACTVLLWLLPSLCSVVAP